jgi:phenol hydroxylase P0 protein
MGQQGVDQKTSSFDASRRYVRVCAHRPDGFVEFEFAIGDPVLCVELMLPEAAFHEFCLANEVITLESLEANQTDWVSRMNEASLRDIGDAV